MEKNFIKLSSDTIRGEEITSQCVRLTVGGIEIDGVCEITIDPIVNSSILMANIRAFITFEELKDA